jgi:DNA invertase Pin-like site-specific DNA recombinase
MDTRTAAGKALFGIMSVLAQLERDLISEQTRQGAPWIAAIGQNERNAPPDTHKRTKHELMRL